MSGLCLVEVAKGLSQICYGCTHMGSSCPRKQSFRKENVCCYYRKKPENELDTLFDKVACEGQRVTVERVNAFVAVCKVEKRELTDKEFVEAKLLNWKLTCKDKTCRYYVGAFFDCEVDPCIECQTDHVWEDV
jgi:hypothetical protein